MPFNFSPGPSFSDFNLVIAQAKSTCFVHWSHSCLAFQHQSKHWVFKQLLFFEFSDLLAHAAFASWKASVFALLAGGRSSVGSLSDEHSGCA